SIPRRGDRTRRRRSHCDRSSSTAPTARWLRPRPRGYARTRRAVPRRPHRRTDRQGLPRVRPSAHRGRSPMTTGVLIADHQGLVRGGFRVLVDAAPDMTVIGEAGDGADAVALSRLHHPDVVLMDIRMPGLDGIAATRQITTDAHTSNVRVLILTTFDLDEYVFASLRAGASGFLLKDTSPEELLAAIRIIAAG